MMMGHCYAHVGEILSKGKGGIFSTVTDAIKSKLTMPTDVVEETRAAREEGGAGRGEVPEDAEKVEIKAVETRPGAVASTLKAADQMTAQTFNDVGRMDDERVIHPEGKARPGKM